jgi:hypothetical protein
MHLKSVVYVSLLWSSAVFAVQPRIDQEQPAVNNTGPTLAIGSGSHQKLAQVFTAGQSGRLTHVMVPISCDPAATITIQIQGVSGGLPSGVALASETVSGITYPTYTPPYSTVPDAGFRLVEFQPSHVVIAGTQYAIVLSAVGDCSILSAPSGDFYTGGHAYYDALPNPSGWVPLAPPQGPSDDLSFQTFVLVRLR